MSPDVVARDDATVPRNGHSSGSKYGQTHLEKQHQHQQRRRRQHVHFDEGNMEGYERREMEASCEHNPTELFLLMNRQLWDAALTHLHRSPIEARVWISSFSPDGRECKWRNLPLHLACLHGPEPVPLPFMEALVAAHPEAAQCRNHEGSLPIHLACECVDLSPRFGLEAEGILITLIKAFPDCLVMRDSMGRRPIDVLEEGGIHLAISQEQSVGRGAGIVKFMKSKTRGMTEVEQEREDRGSRFMDDRSQPKRRPKSIKIPKCNPIMRQSSKDESHMRHKRERIEQMEHPKAISENHVEEYRHSNVSTHFQYSPPTNQVMQENVKSEAVNYDASDEPVDIIEPRSQKPNAVSPISPFNPALTVTPHNQVTMPPERERMDPFTHLEAELTSMRSAHQFMSENISTKDGLINDLQERLRKLDDEHAQLQSDFAKLTKDHSRTVAEMEQQSKEVEKCNYEVHIVRSKEHATSSELAIKLQVEATQKKEIIALKNELVKERDARDVATKQLEKQTRVCEDFNVISIEKDLLSAENKELRSQLSQKTKQLHEAKGKETTLLGLMSKMHSQEGLEENKELQLQLSQKSKQLQEIKMRESKARSVNEKMSKKNKELQSNLAHHGELIQELRAKESNSSSECKKLSDDNMKLQAILAQESEQLQETKTMTSKLMEQLSEKEPLIRNLNKEVQMHMSQNSHMIQEAKTNETTTASRLSEISNKNNHLQSQLTHKNEQLQKAKTKLMELLAKNVGDAKGNDDSEVEALHAKNSALRNVALQAIKYVSALQQRVEFPSSSYCVETGLRRLLKDAESNPMAGTSYSQNIGTASAHGSLKLLQPVINDAQSLQKDAADHIKQLLRQSHDIMKLTDLISTIPEEKISFESTLQILEGTITSHVQVLETLSQQFETRENCKSRLLSLFESQPLKDNENLEQHSKKGGDVSESSVMECSKKLVLITKKHLEKLESLSKTVAGIPQLKRLNLDLDRKDMQKHLNMVDEITTVLQRALSNLVQDAKQLEMANQEIQNACDTR